MNENQFCVIFAMAVIAAAGVDSAAPWLTTAPVACVSSNAVAMASVVGNAIVPDGPAVTVVIRNPPETLS